MQSALHIPGFFPGRLRWLVLAPFLVLVQGLQAQHITVSPLPGCLGDTVDVIFTGDYAQGTTFNWSFPCGSISNPTLPNPHRAALVTAGDCTVSVEVTPQGGAPLVYTFSFETFSRPRGRLGNDTLICEGNCTALPLHFTGFAPFEYSYRMGTELFIDTAYSNLDTLIECPVTDRAIYLLTLSDAYCDNNNARDTANILVQPAFEASIIDVGIHTRALPNGNQYAWYSCDFTQYYGSFQQWVIPQDGCYACIVSNGACVDTAYYSRCNADCSFTAPVQICPGGNATYDFTGNTNGFEATLRWTLDRGNGQVQIIENQDPIQVNYPNPGNYMVTLTILYNGCEVSCSDTLRVRPRPQVDLCCADTICPGTCIVLKGAMSGAGTLQYQLRGPNNTLVTGVGIPGSTANIPVCPPASGWYRIDTLRDPIGCTTVRADSVYLTLHPDINGSVTVEDNVLTAHPAGLTYKWLSCVQQLILSGNRSFAPPTSGCYMVVISNGTCTDTVKVDFVLCTLNCNWSVPAKVCKGDPFTLQFTGSAPAATEFDWQVVNGSDQHTFTGKGPHTFDPKPGCYQVVLKQTYLTCSEICQDTFCVFEKPGIQLCCASSLCRGECKTLNITLSGKAPWSFKLDDGDNTTSFSNILTTNYAETICPEQATTYTAIEISDANGCPGVTGSSAHFSVFPKPNASAQIQGDSLCGSPVGMDYGWYDCAGGVYFSTSRCIKPPSGCYCVDVTNGFECVDSACINYIPTGLDEVIDQSIAIYPNPVRDGLLKISLDAAITGEARVKLSDLSGRPLYLAPIEPGQSRPFSLSIPVPAAGMYLLSIEIAGHWYTRKIVVQQ